MLTVLLLNHYKRKTTTRRPRIAGCEVQINKVYGAFQKGGLFVFDDLAELKEELTTYSRKLNDRDEPTEEIEDEADYHLHAALRYVVSDLGVGLRIMRSGTIMPGEEVHAPNVDSAVSGRRWGHAPPGTALRFARCGDWRGPRPRTPPTPPGRSAEEVEAILEAASREQRNERGK